MITKHVAYFLFPFVKDVEVYVHRCDGLFIVSHMLFTLISMVFIDGVYVLCVNVTFVLLGVDVFRDGSEHFAV